MTTIIQALAAVMADVREVRKDQTNQHQRFNFRGIDTVMNAVGPAFRKHGVVCLPTKVDHHIASKTVGKNSSLMNFVTVNVEYTLYGPEGDHITGNVSAESFDSGDKGTAKAMSVAYRTFLLQALCLPTDDPDPDHDTYQETRPQENAQAGPDWAKHYQAAVDKGPETLAKFLQWARQKNGPAEMIQAGEQLLAQTSGKAVEGEVLTNED